MTYSPPVRPWPAPGAPLPTKDDFPAVADIQPPLPGEPPRAQPQPTFPTFAVRERTVPFTVAPAIRVTLEHRSPWYKNSEAMIDSPESLSAAQGRCQALSVALRCKTLPKELAEDASLELSVVAAKVARYRKLHRC